MIGVGPGPPVEQDVLPIGLGDRLVRGVAGEPAEPDLVLVEKPPEGSLGEREALAGPALRVPAVGQPEDAGDADPGGGALGEDLASEGIELGRGRGPRRSGRRAEDPLGDVPAAFDGVRPAPAERQLRAVEPAALVDLQPRPVGFPATIAEDHDLAAAPVAEDRAVEFGRGEVERVGDVDRGPQLEVEDGHPRPREPGASVTRSPRRVARALPAQWHGANIPRVRRADSGPADSIAAASGGRSPPLPGIASATARRWRSVIDPSVFVSDRGIPASSLRARVRPQRRWLIRTSATAMLSASHGEVRITSAARSCPSAIRRFRSALASRPRWPVRARAGAVAARRRRSLSRPCDPPRRPPSGGRSFP